MMLAVAAKTGTMMIIDWGQRELLGPELDKLFAHVIFYLRDDAPLPPADILRQLRLIEIAESAHTVQRIQQLKAINPALVVAVRIELDADGEQRAIALAHNPVSEVLHIAADMNGAQIGVEKAVIYQGYDAAHSYLAGAERHSR